METAKNIELNKYMGKWYEIARLPNSFQKECSCTTAEYKVVDDDILVKNQCYKDSVLTTATAKAWRLNDNDNSKLKVRFFWPFTGNYWILYVSDDYKYAVVGEPSRKYLWFLSRTKEVSQAKLDFMEDVALKNNYNLRNLMVANNTDCKGA